jgi:polyhydroxyalkanoate synthase
MREQASATSQFSPWREWYKVRLSARNKLINDGFTLVQGWHCLSPWLACNAAYLKAWNQILVLWMKTSAFAQFLGTLAEAYSNLSTATRGLMPPERRGQIASSRLPTEQECGGQFLRSGISHTPRRLVWTRKPVRLYHYDESAQTPAKYRTPLLLVYSLINKPYILDLLPGRSLIGYLVQHGVDVYLLDWGIPGPQEERLGFTDLVVEYLPDCLRQVQRLSGQEHFHLFGYCIGGVLITLYTALYPDAPCASLVLLATPLDFSDAGLLGCWLGARFFDVDRFVDRLGNIPAEFIMSGGCLLSQVGGPALLWEYTQDARFLEVWQALRYWAMDGVPFPGEAFRQWVKDFYQGNKLITDQLTLNGQRVHLSCIHTPLLNIVAASDQIIPLAQTSSTLAMISSMEKEEIILPGNHFGPVSSPKAVQDLWPRIVAWIARHSPE